MNSVSDKFIDDLEKNMAVNKVGQKTGAVTISLADYDVLVGAKTMLDVLQNAYVQLEGYDFAKVAGLILGEEPAQN